MRFVCSLVVVLLVSTGSATAQKITLIKMPYSGARNVAELSGGPDYLAAGGLREALEAMGATVRAPAAVALREDEEQDYGEWHRMGMANGHLANLVADEVRDGNVTIGLLSNCTSVIGTLGGLQHAGPTRRPLKVGLVFIDSHGDFNTPETTLSGMLGGMPVAVSAGMALTNLRLESGLDPALPTRHIVIGGARDLDPLEADLLDRSEVQMLSVNDLRDPTGNLHAQMERLSNLTDIIYVHIDMDVLDPAEVPGHPLTVPNGPTSWELANALRVMFKYDKVAALGIASTPYGDRDPDGVSREAAYNLIEGAVRGLQDRAQ